MAIFADCIVPSFILSFKTCITVEGEGEDQNITEKLPRILFNIFFDDAFFLTLMI